jgi:uncharacterized protein
MIIDGHVHLFHPKVILNVKKRVEMVRILSLQTDGAEDRVGVPFLENELKNAGISGGFILPTALAEEVADINEEFYKLSQTSELLYTAGTLHPEYPGNRQELEIFISRNIRGIKLCSFSQRFALDAGKTLEMFQLIQEFNIHKGTGFFVELDTLFGADQFFGSQPEHNTTPSLLADLIRSFPKIDFIAAHMGGLAAPFHEIKTHLVPMDNLYLDTSNAAHVLSKDDFIYLLKTHGPQHIIFGTDWPWFTHEGEIKLQHQLYEKAGFSKNDKDLIFAQNMIRLTGGSYPKGGGHASAG